jgi:hypothetical protein
MSPKHKGSGFDSSGLCPANQKKGKTTTALEIVTAGATKKKPTVGMDIAAGFIIVFSIFFVIVNFIGVLAGSADYSRSGSSREECNVRTKWSYVLPGYRFGCWMSEPLAVAPEVEWNAAYRLTGCQIDIGSDQNQVKVLCTEGSEDVRRFLDSRRLFCIWRDK